MINRLVTGVSQSESDYSDATQSDDSSKPRQKPKRKPNLAWCNMTQNNSTEDDDLIKRKTSSDRDSDITYEPVDRPVEFTRKISVKGSVQSRLGSNVKSRLGPATNEQSVKKRIGLPLKSRLGKESTLVNRLGPRIPQENRNSTPTTVATNSNVTRGGDELTNNEQTQPKKKKLILIKRKQPSEPKIENDEVQVKKSKPSPESKPEPPVPKQIPKPIPTVTTNHNADSKVQKSEQIISAEIKSETPKAKKVTKVSVTDDLEDELLEGGDDLELGNEIIDDDLFDL